ncbi:hypothetical protein [Microbacterium sp. P5_E9]
MKVIATTWLGGALMLASISASAQDAAKKDGTPKDSGTTMVMTMQQCKQHMAISEKAGAKKDDAMVKKDTMCNELMNQSGGMSKGGMTGEPMKK